MCGQHIEAAFETAIEHHLTTAGGYEKGDKDAFDPARALISTAVTGKIDVRKEVEHS